MRSHTTVPLARAGVRLRDREFRDFVLGRLSKARLGEAAGSDPHDDSGWQTRIDLLIAPHPKLTEAQAAAIALDYGMRGGKCTISVRRALLFYALRRLGLDVAANVRRQRATHRAAQPRGGRRGAAHGPRLERRRGGLVMLEDWQLQTSPAHGFITATCGVAQPYRSQSPGGKIVGRM